MADRGSAVRETPRDIVLLAKAMARDGDVEGALTLLVGRQGDWKKPPPAYYAMIGRCLLRLDRHEAAADYLVKARDEYQDMPIEQRRDLAIALFNLGRFEASGREFALILQEGGNVARPAYKCAVDAYVHRAGETLDAHPPSPYCVLTKAHALTETRQFEAARQVLLSALAAHRESWGAVPPAFDAMLGRVSLRLGDRDTAIAALSRARDAAGEADQANVSLPLGTALFEVGHFAQAGRELDLAQQGGAAIGRAELLMAINAYRRNAGRHDLIDVRFARNLTLTDPDRRVVYVALAKNACTLLKATIVLGSRFRDAYLESEKTIHEFCGELTAGGPPPPAIQEAGYFRFVVLRDPLRRTLSAYLDKFVRDRLGNDYTALQVARTVRAAQAALDINPDPHRSITFEEFVRFLSITDDISCDMHWMPQVNVVGTDLGVYDHVGTVERLDDTLDLLAARFGYVKETSLARHLRKGDRHITHFSQASGIAAPHRALPAELAALEDGVPAPELFLTPDITQLLRRRFAADVAVHAAASK